MSRAKTLCAAALVIVALCGGAAADGATPVPPVLSSTFQTGVIIQSVPWSLNPPGQFVGFMATDSVQLKTLMVANESSFDVEILKLYKSGSQPQGMQYEYVATQQTCTPETLSEEYFAWFGWLPDAQYVGPTILQEQYADLWVMNVTNAQGGMALSLYVTRDGTHTPIRFTTASSTDMLTNIIDFYDFQPTTPPAGDFNIPPFCQSNANANANAAGAGAHKRKAVAPRSASRLEQFHAMTKSINKHIGQCTAAMGDA